MNKEQQEITKINQEIEGKEKERQELENKIKQIENKRGELYSEIIKLEEQQESLKKRHYVLSEIKLDEEVGIKRPSRNEAKEKIKIWEEITGKPMDTVDTEYDWWKNDDSTLVIRVKVKPEEAGKIAELLKWWGRGILADEIGIEITDNGETVDGIIARFWWE